MSIVVGEVMNVRGFSAYILAAKAKSSGKVSSNAKETTNEKKKENASGERTKCSRSLGWFPHIWSTIRCDRSGFNRLARLNLVNEPHCTNGETKEEGRDNVRKS
jgi:hypothetical protein